MKYIGAVLSVFILFSMQVLYANTDKNIKNNSIENYEAQERLSQIDFFEKKKLENRPIVAIVLGSGGARGYAHIGAMEVLEEIGVKPDFIVGTSAGSIVGALYASGKSSLELRQIALNLRPKDVRDLTINLKGFFEGEKVQNYINKQVENTPLQNLKIPMYVVATELQYGKKTVFNYGNTGQAVRASVSIPSVFIPPKIGEKEYVDGGLASPVPVKVARELGADIIIAVDILVQPMNTETNHLWGLFNQNIHIMQNHMAEEELKYADIVIQPYLPEKTHIFNMRGRENTMQAGIDAAKQQISQLVQVFEDKKVKHVLNKNVIAHLETIDVL